MQTNEQRSAERFERLSHSVTIAAKLKPLVDDPDVKECLDSLEKALIESMITAKTTYGRDRAAAEINALRKVRATLATLAYGGNHSLKKLEQMKVNEDVY